MHFCTYLRSDDEFAKAIEEIGLSMFQSPRISSAHIGPTIYIHNKDLNPESDYVVLIEEVHDPRFSRQGNANVRFSNEAPSQIVPILLKAINKYQGLYPPTIGGHPNASTINWVTPD